MSLTILKAGAIRITFIASKVIAVTTNSVQVIPVFFMRSAEVFISFILPVADTRVKQLSGFPVPSK